MNKETGAKEIIPEPSRFNQFLVVGPSGTGKSTEQEKFNEISQNDFIRLWAYVIT